MKTKERVLIAADEPVRLSIGGSQVIYGIGAGPDQLWFSSLASSFCIGRKSEVTAKEERRHRSLLKTAVGHK